jgi:hypothetical protein
MLTTLALALTVAVAGVNAVPTISAKGSKFFTSDGDQFYVKGKFCFGWPVTIVANSFRRRRVPTGP